MNQSVNTNLGAGYKGNGTLRIADGTSVASSYGYLGYSSGSLGTATVTGNGSQWVNSSSLYVGNSGDGILRIDSGGKVTNTYGYLGYDYGSTGTALVSGTGATWVNSNDLYVGRFGNGTLTVADGGMVSVAKTIYASLSSLSGNGTITANGAVLDGDFAFDATHGSQQVIPFGTGGALSLNHNSDTNLGVGYQGSGTLRIADGLAVGSSYGYLGYCAGSVGATTVTGAGSKWTNNNYLYVGYGGTGTLSVEAGGQAVNTNGYLGYSSGSFGTATVTGNGSRWTNSGNLTVGLSGSGVLTISAGGQVSDASATLGGNAGSAGTATVNDAGSLWANTGDLFVGRSGSGGLTVANSGTVTVGGTLYAPLASLFGDGTITAKGAVLDANLVFDSAHGLQQTITFGSTGSLNLSQSANCSLGAGYQGTGSLRIAEGVAVTSISGYLAYNPGAAGAATVTGTNSKWTINGLYVGYGGIATLDIDAGGQVINQSQTSYLGYNSGSSGTATISGTASKLTNSSLLVGYSGAGALNVNAGGVVTSGSSTLGNSPGSLGTATIAGTGSSWTNSATLNVGYSGGGALTIESGGQVSDSNGYVGYYSGSTGTVVVTDSASKWTNSGNLYVGYYGNGTLNVEAGGQLSNTSDAYLGYNPGSTGSVTVTGTNSAWKTNNGNLYVGYFGNGTLTVADGGVVNVVGTLYSALGSLQGNGTITARSAVLRCRACI